MSTLDYRALAVLEAVASTGSFEKAALALGISQSAVSQRIKALEDATGRLLVVRGTPSVPTGLGQRLVMHQQHVRLMEASLDIDLGRAQSMPALSVAVDSDSLATWFAQVLPPVMSPPRCQLDVQQADTEQALRLVRDGTVFGCVAAATGEGAQGTAITPLGMMRYTCVSTPAFARHWFGDGFSAEAVALAPALVSERNLLARYLAQRFGTGIAYPRHTVPLASALKACVLAGAGYGLVPELMALGPLSTGQLVELVPGDTFALSLNWHAWNIDTPFTRTLTEQVIETARHTLLQP
jgi:LysR family transcriptional regulator (chromosome initiation inhibitor)